MIRRLMIGTLLIVYLQLSASAQPPLDYDATQYPALQWGYNDLNLDGVADTLITTWNGKVMAFVSDNGQLPWPADVEQRDWDMYFDKAFDVGADPPVTWNPMRRGWGGYAIMVDRDESGRFDDYGDWYYKVLDLNGDGNPDGEFYHTYPGHNHGSKTHINLDGEHEMSSLKWGDFWYGYENQSVAGGQYIMNVSGSGFFVNAYAPQVQTGIENPLAWYDFDFDGFNDMSMRSSDANYADDARTRHSGYFEQVEIAFELNGNTSAKRWHSLDMQMTFVGDGRFRDQPLEEDHRLPYAHHVDRIPGIEILKDAEFLLENRRQSSLEILRRYMPYLDGYRIATDFDRWASVWLQFDEDDDDTRWEEMFTRYEPATFKLSDRIGDRYERDSLFAGKGKLYVGRFDGRIHLYHADFAVWDVDPWAIFKGEEAYFSTTTDRADDGPEPPVGLRYPRVRYTDTDGNGFIDRIDYMTVEYTGEFGTELETERIERTVSLLDYADEDNPHPDVCELFDPRVNMPLTGWRVATWDGKPLDADDFEGSPVKVGYDRVQALYAQACERIWADATQLHATAVELGLNRSQSLDVDFDVAALRASRMTMRQLALSDGYSQHLEATTRRERYNHGYWLRERVFADILRYADGDKHTMQGLYYTGDIDGLCRYLREQHAVASP